MLTGIVLGALKNLDPSIAVDAFLHATPLHGNTPLNLGSQLHWTFWPSWPQCEPDVVIEDEGNLVLVEAKLYSDFGTHEDEDKRQLQREWYDGSRVARDRGRRFSLVTLTNHGSVPIRSIEHQLTGSYADRERVYWLSWLDIGRAIRRATGISVAGWREDLLLVLERMGLAPFDGFDGAKAAVPDEWNGLPWLVRAVLPTERASRVQFDALLDTLALIEPALSVSWRFSRSRSGRSAGFASVIAALPTLEIGESTRWRLRL